MLRRSLVVLAAALVAGAIVLPASSAATAKAKVTKVVVLAGKPSEFRFTLRTKVVRRGATVFTIQNKGTIPHDFKIAGKRTKLIQPGKSATLRVVFKKAGKYPYLCTVPGHAAAGMKGVLRVK